MAQLTYPQIKALVGQNNSSSLTTELIVAIAWKESSFDPAAVAAGSTATGLMMMTVGAVADVNAHTPAGIHFEHSEMTDAARNIACATQYLRILLGRFGNDKVVALEHYGTGLGYADNLLTAERCLQSLVVPDPMTCLRQIHP